MTQQLPPDVWDAMGAVLPPYRPGLEFTVMDYVRRHNLAAVNSAKQLLDGRVRKGLYVTRQVRLANGHRATAYRPAGTPEPGN